MGRGSGVSMGEVVTPPPSLGNTCALRCHPAVRPLPPGRVFPGAGGSPQAMPLCSSTSAFRPRPRPATAGGFRLSLVRETRRVGSSGGWKTGFSQLGAGSSSCASWKVTCDLQNPCVRWWLFFFCGLVTKPLLVLRKEELR